MVRVNTQDGDRSGVLWLLYPLPKSITKKGFIETIDGSKSKCSSTLKNISQFQTKIKGIVSQDFQNLLMI